HDGALRSEFSEPAVTDHESARAEEEGEQPQQHHRAALQPDAAGRRRGTGADLSGRLAHRRPLLCTETETRGAVRSGRCCTACLAAWTTRFRSSSVTLNWAAAFTCTRLPLARTRAPVTPSWSWTWCSTKRAKDCESVTTVTSGAGSCSRTSLLRAVSASASSSRPTIATPRETERTAGSCQVTEFRVFWIPRQGTSRPSVAVWTRAQKASTASR